MKTKIFALFAAMMLLVGTTAMAQSDDTKNTSTTETSLKGDVNADGVVDVADIAAVIAVMHEQGTVETKYYWYAGWTEPTEANIGQIINEEYPATNTDSTLHKAGGSTTNIDNINADYTTNKLFDSSILTTLTTRKYYVVVPQGCKIYNSIGNPSTAFTIHPIEIANQTVYISNSVSAFINAIKIY